MRKKFLLLILALALVPGPIHRVDQQDVWPAVGVVIEKSAAGTERLRKKLAAVGSGVVRELDSRWPACIDETKAWTRRRQRKRRCSGNQSRAKATPDEFASLHGRLTSPLRMA